MPEQNIQRIINNYIPNGLDLVLKSNASRSFRALYFADRFKIFSSKVIDNPRDRAEMIRYILSQIEGHKEEVLHQRGHEDVLDMLGGIAQLGDLSKDERDYAAKLREELVRLDAGLRQQQPSPSAGAPRSISFTDVHVQETPHGIHAAQELGQMLGQQVTTKRI